MMGFFVGFAERSPAGATGCTRRLVTVVASLVILTGAVARGGVLGV